MMKQSKIILVSKKILLVMIGLSSMLFADFNRSSTGVITDCATGLEWQDDYSDNGGNIKEANWRDAIAYCNNLQLDGGGWRLPNINELRSIVDYTKYDPAINSSFQNSTSNRYWDSTTSIALTSYAWIVSFYDGSGGAYNKSYTLDVRCVRGGNN